MHMAPILILWDQGLYYHKTQQSVQNGGDTPAWVPGAWMEIAHAQTESCVGLEPSVGCNHPDRWWFERIVCRKDELA